MAATLNPPSIAAAAGGTGAPHTTGRRTAEAPATVSSTPIDKAAE